MRKPLVSISLLIMAMEPCSGKPIYINGNLLIDNDGQHAPTAKEATITLAAGEHTLLLDYFQGPRYQIALELFWKTPGSTAYVYVPKASFK